MSDESKRTMGVPHEVPELASEALRPEGDGWRFVNGGMCDFIDPRSSVAKPWRMWQWWAVWARPEPAPLPEAKGPWAWHEDDPPGADLRSADGETLMTLYDDGTYRRWGGSILAPLCANGTRETVAAEAHKHWRET